jgi:hypothetical protein
MDLHPLVAYLVSPRVKAGDHDGWAITPLQSAGNGLVFRARRGADDLVVKFTPADERRRAAREFDALTALRQLGVALAPEPILLDEQRFRLPVVVQRWLAGTVAATPPERDEDWSLLVEHYALVHAVTPERVQQRLRRSVHTAFDVTEAVGLVYAQLALVPDEHHPEELLALVRRAGALPAVRRCAQPVLCRSDPNPANFIRAQGRWRSVDWENSGWGDAAFEIADLLCHPEYLAVPDARRDRVVTAYAAATGDAAAVQRIHAYRPARLLWYAARLVQLRFEVPRALEPAPASGATGGVGARRGTAARLHRVRRGQPRDRAALTSSGCCATQAALSLAHPSR